MSAESPRHARSGGPLTVPAQPPTDRSIIDAVSGFISDVTLSGSSTQDPKDVIQWARFETADINEPTPEDASDNDISPLLLILGYGAGVQVWLIPPTGEAQEVLSWRQGTVRVLRILPTPQHGDCFASKRPLIALCDSASPGPSFCSLSFISIRGGEQVKSIKFKNPILDVLANKRSVVVSFSERFAVFDAATLEDRMAVTTCYPCPCPLGGSQPINPLALGDRWLAYADKKLNPSKRSSGGCEGEGVTSYTATVLHAAKSLSKGLRGLGESVAHSLAGGRSTSQSPSPPNADLQQPGVVTILDIEGNDEEDGQELEDPCDPIIAHFVAHSDAVIALKFDASGMLLVTADRRGHDFHVFRVNPHPCGPSLASVHHLYVLHRGDTTAKVQDIAISVDARWAAISTLRGTTHIFALSPYGGACGVRTHTAPRVVNRLSRFHRSAGLPIHTHQPTHAHAHTHSGSPVSDGVAQGAWFPNPRLPPYPLPTTAPPLAQLRPTANLPTHTITRTSSGRQRLSSLSEDSTSVPLLARARFGLAPCPGGSRAPPAAALYLVAASGCLSHIALHPRPQRNVAKEKICDETPIELEVEPIAQWPLQRPPAAVDLLAPLPPSNPLLQPMSCRRCADLHMSEEERWLSQVEIVTHAGPHRRLWMGPQFVFKTYNSTGSNSSLSEAETVEVDTCPARGVARSNPVNMPGVRPVVPVLIDSGSASSLEHSPSDSFRRKSLLAESGRAASVCDVQLKEDLAEAMKEDHGWRAAVRTPPAARRAGVERVVGPAGTVVAPPRAHPPAPLADPDAYTSSNSDEATFRPVVRASATLPTIDMDIRPLPLNTTIPVQNISPLHDLSPRDEPLPLNTDVVIPAALTAVRNWNPPDRAQAVDVANVARVAVAEYEKDDRHQIDEIASGSTPPIDIAVKEDTCTLQKVSEIDKVNVKEFATELKDCDIKMEKLGKQEDSGAKVDKSAKQTYSAVKLEVAEKKIIESDKPARLKDSKFDKSGVKHIPVKIDKSIDPKYVAARIDKSFKQKDLVVDKQAKRSDEYEMSIPVEQKETKFDRVALQKTFDEPRDKTTEPNKRVSTDVASKLDRINIDFKEPNVNKDLKRQENDVRKRDSARERSSAERAERERDDSKSLPKSNQAPDDIQPVARTRIKKSPTPKSVSDRDSEVSVKDNKAKKIDESKEVYEPKEVKETKEIKKQKDFKEPRVFKEFRGSFKDVKSRDDQQSMEAKDFVDISKHDKRESETKETTVDIDETQIAVTLRLPTKKESQTQQIIQENRCQYRRDDDIRTEDQAWDLLLNEPEKPMQLNVSQQSTISDKSAEEKPKSKRNRKARKSHDNSQAKADEDSFVEIHAIDEKQTCSDDLVSISTHFDDVEPSSTYLSKDKKSRSPKNCTPERFDDYENKSVDLLFQMEPEPYSNKLKGFKKYDDMPNIEVLSETHRLPTHREAFKANTLKLKKHYDGTASESSSFVIKEPKTYKSKSLSPYPESRRLSENTIEMSDKDVYVIDTTEEDFPDIQITRGNTSRKRSPQPVERKSQERELLVEKPVIKSWSSIAASKTVKKEEEKMVETFDKKIEKVKKKDEFKNFACALDENPLSSPTVSLQDKLIELCKRTDIMVAECDAPSELNFVEEHHAVVHDLPPLEPLDFGLDDFNLEVMRDSLLEINDAKLTSPICKINIDDILSSIKETTSKVIESSAFNLIDLEKVPAKKEKGFSVIESHKITSQEVKLDDDPKAAEGEMMEKSSDEDITPVVTTDSDKEDKKTAGASNLVLPSSKQSAKSKKSRRKKK